MPAPILLDIDGVVADFVHAFTKLLKWVGSDIAPYRTHEQPSWDFLHDAALVEDAWQEILGSHSWWTMNLDPLPGATRAAWERLDKWADREGRQLTICTSRSGKRVHDQTKAWLDEHFGPAASRHPIIVTAKARYKVDIARGVGADTIIDDAPHTLRRMTLEGLRVFAPEYQYNTGIEGVHYVRDFDHFVEELTRG